MKTLVLILSVLAVSACQSFKPVRGYEQQYDMTVEHTPALDRTANVYAKAAVMFCGDRPPTSFIHSRYTSTITCTGGGRFTFKTERIGFDSAKHYLN